jgi:hypothetical protein
MGDIFAPLRQLIDPKLQAVERVKLSQDQFLGRIGAFEFCVVPDFGDLIVILLRKVGGKVTDANIDAFWRHWGYEPPDRYEEIRELSGSHVKIVIPKDEVENMIKSTPKGASRRPYAEVKCDHCGFTENFRADYERVSPDKFEVKEGQVLMKATHKGWSNVKGSLRCPECETKRRDAAKPQKEITVTNVLNLPKTEEARQPSRDQKREIIALLNEVYDTKVGRYTGGETDKTVAETIGGGVMLGWVAQVREDLFGPDGGNDDLLELRDEVQAAIFECTAVAKQCQEDIDKAVGTLKSYNGVREKLVDILTRIDKLKKAVGPKGDGI